MLPRMMVVRQNFPSNNAIEDVDAAFGDSLDRIHFDATIFKGKKVGIAVGSRGISHESEAVAYIVRLIRKNGGSPEVFAAMGSHGDGTAEGQREVLDALGINEKKLKCPVMTGADWCKYGKTVSGIPVYGSKLPFRYDAIVLINRVKMHTDFEDVIESGIFKLMAIGIGNPKGCNNVHQNAVRYGFARTIYETAMVMLEKLPVVLGFMLTENWKHELDRVVAVIPENFYETEIELLSKVKAQAVRLPVAEADALIVGEIGKNISGTGMDTKVVGRIRVLGQQEPKEPKFRRIAVMNITEGSHGNAIGIGLADYAPMRLYKEINIEATSLNGWSSLCPEQSMLPCFISTDYDTILQSVSSVGAENTENTHIVYIENTNKLEYIAVSEALYMDELRFNKKIEKITEPFELKFDENGRLLTVWRDSKLIDVW